MNHYPSWWDSTITLYNKYTDSDKKVKWYKTVLEGCYYSHSLDKITVGKTTIASNVSVCRIRVNDSFIGKGDWIKLQDSERAEYFTLATGDIIVAGEIDFNIDEYTQGSRSSDMIKQYTEWPGCFTIESVSINTGGGRGNEHYHVRGT